MLGMAYDRELGDEAVNTYNFIYWREAQRNDLADVFVPAETYGYADNLCQDFWAAG